MDKSHRWSDVSYHGSPQYQCDLCGAYERTPEAALPCPKLKETLKKEAAQKERDERWAYKKLLERRAYEAYLDSKYGPVKSNRSGVWTGRPQ